MNCWSCGKEILGDCCWGCHDQELEDKCFIRTSSKGLLGPSYKEQAEHDLLKPFYGTLTGNSVLDSGELSKTKWVKQDPTSRMMTLSTDSADRKNYPLFRGLLRYFPAALAGIARTSWLGNEKHNPGKELHHARSKSGDHGDCILRHMMDVEDLKAALERGDAGVTKEQILEEVNCACWRMLALSQELHELYGAPLAPGAK